MNILLAGGSCSLVDSLILKLRKEGHRVYILTGDQYRHNKYKKVFEKYEFPYDSENLITVIKACNESEKNTVYENALDKALNSLKLS